MREYCRWCDHLAWQDHLAVLIPELYVESLCIRGIMSTIHSCVLGPAILLLPRVVVYTLSQHQTVCPKTDSLSLILHSSPTVV